MGCLSSKEKHSDQNYRGEQNQRAHQRRESDAHRRGDSAVGQRRYSDSGGGGQRLQGAAHVHGNSQSRRGSQSSAGSNSSVNRQGMKRVEVNGNQGFEPRNKERVVTDPRGGRRVRDRDTPVSKDAIKDNGTDSLSKRNQFDRASQLRRSKKGRKNKETTGTPGRSPAKTAKDIVSQETEANQMSAMTGHCRTEYHSKYGNLI